MGLINWIFDIYQDIRIDDARDEAAALRAKLASLSSRGGSIDSVRLERALGELALATKTVQRLLVEKGVCTTDEFARKLRELELREGQVDGPPPP